MNSIPERIKRLVRELGVDAVEAALHGVDLLSAQGERLAHARLDEIEPLGARCAAACELLLRIKQVHAWPAPWTVGRARRLIGYVPEHRKHDQEPED